jgi:GT2 family glycosyltransferase
MRLSVCIATYNVCELAKNCFKTLLEADQGRGLISEIIVVDDDSDDGTSEFLKTLRPPFRVVFNETNRGCVCANNRAAREATSDVLCFLNSDTVLKPGWIEPMLKVIAAYPDAGMVGNLQWNPATRRYDHMGAFFGENGVPKHFGKDWRWAPFRGVKQWPAVTAACCMIKKDVFESVNGFDETFRNSFEDMDICLRLSQKGYINFVACGSRILHHVSSSPGRHDRDKIEREIFLKRWGGYLAERRNGRERRLEAIDYLLRFWDRPWKYNGPKFLRYCGSLPGLR